MEEIIHTASPTNEVSVNLALQHMQLSHGHLLGLNNLKFSHNTFTEEKPVSSKCKYNSKIKLK